MLKKWGLLLGMVALCLLPAAGEAASPVSRDGYYKGIRLCGRVKVVKHFGDIRVKVVEHFPDLKVQIVNNFPDRIGQWKFVDYGADFTVQFVEHAPDIKIQYVRSFPGIP